MDLLSFIEREKMGERVAQAGPFLVRDQGGKSGLSWVSKFDHKWTECFLTVFVGGLAIGIEKKEIREVFACFGRVTDVHLLMRDAKHRGFTFVRFCHLVELHKLLERCGDLRVEGVRVSLAVANRRSNFWRGS